MPALGPQGFHMPSCPQDLMSMSIWHSCGIVCYLCTTMVGEERGLRMARSVGMPPPRLTKEEASSQQEQSTGRNRVMCT